jgi:hypothetical protein
VFLLLRLIRSLCHIKITIRIQQWKIILAKVLISRPKVWVILLKRKGNEPQHLGSELQRFSSRPQTLSSEPKTLGSPTPIWVVLPKFWLDRPQRFSSVPQTLGSFTFRFSSFIQVLGSVTQTEGYFTLKKVQICQK